MKHYGVKQVVVHINSTSFFKVVRRIGVDAVISKNTSAVNDVLKIIRSDEDKLSVSRFEEIDIEVVELTVKENSDFINRNLSIKDLPEEICLGSIIRMVKLLYPIIKQIYELMMSCYFSLNLKIFTLLNSFFNYD